MTTFRKDMHLGQKVPMVETDDIVNGAITPEKLNRRVWEALVSNLIKNTGSTAIGPDGYWYVDGVNTYVKAQGRPGRDGKDADVWTIGEDNHWYLNGERTEFVSKGEDGKDGVSPVLRVSADGMSLEISSDGGETWLPFVKDFNLLRVLGYLDSKDQLPKNAEVGHIYGVWNANADNGANGSKGAYELYINTVLDWVVDYNITKVYSYDTELPSSAADGTAVVVPVNDLTLDKNKVDGYKVYKFSATNNGWVMVLNTAEIYAAKEDIVNYGDNMYALVQGDEPNTYVLYKRVVGWAKFGTNASITYHLVQDVNEGTESNVASGKAVREALYSKDCANFFNGRIYIEYNISENKRRIYTLSEFYYCVSRKNEYIKIPIQDIDFSSSVDDSSRNQFGIFVDTKGILHAESITSKGTFKDTNTYELYCLAVFLGGYSNKTLTSTFLCGPISINGANIENTGLANSTYFSTGERVNEKGIDESPTDDSNNLVESGGVYKEIDKYFGAVHSCVERIDEVKLYEQELTDNCVNIKTGEEVHYDSGWKGTAQFYDISNNKGDLIYIRDVPATVNTGIVFFDETYKYLSGFYYNLVDNNNSSFIGIVPDNAVYAKFAINVGKGRKSTIYFVKKDNNGTNVYEDVNTNFFNGHIKIKYDIEQGIKTIETESTFWYCMGYKNKYIQIDPQTIDFTNVVNSSSRNQFGVFVNNEGILHAESIGSGGTYKDINKLDSHCLGIFLGGYSNKTLTPVFSCGVFNINGESISVNTILSRIKALEDNNIEDEFIEEYTKFMNTTFIFYTNGEYGKNSSFCTTGLIKIRKGDRVIVTGISGSAYGRVYAFFDNNLNPLKWADANVNLVDHEEVADQDGWFAYSSTNTGSNRKCKIIRKAPNDLYFDAIKGVSEYSVVSGSQVDNNGNIIDSSSDISIQTDLVVQKFIYLQKGMDIKLSECWAYKNNGVNTVGAFYQNNGTFISAINVEKSGRCELTIRNEEFPDNAVYCCINQNNNINYAPEVNHISPRYLYSTRDIIPNFGAKVALFGGSHTQFIESRNGKRHWRELLMCDLTTYGRGGGGFIFSTYDNETLQDQVDAAIASREKYDLWILWIPTNDATHGVIPGSATDYTTHDNYDTSKIAKKTNVSTDNGATMAGGINACIKKIFEYDKDAKIYMFSPLRIFNANYGYDDTYKNSIGYAYREYMEVAKECASRYNIPYLNQFDILNVNIFNYDKYFKSDKLHLTTNAYNRLGTIQADFLKNGR